MKLNEEKQRLVNEGQIVPVRDSQITETGKSHQLPHEENTLPSAEEFWKPWEEVVNSFDSLSKKISEVYTKWSHTDHSFAWRGQSDAGRPLYSSLYRRQRWTNASNTAPEERQLQEIEREVLKHLRRWGLHNNVYGRLSVLNQLALLQHYGAPTRLIDVTFNPWISVWFAVEQKWDNGKKRNSDDARVFAFDVSDLLINETSKSDWEDKFSIPWPSAPRSNSDANERLDYKNWTSKLFAWKPPQFHPRIAAQNGGFIFGGVPAGSIHFPKSARKEDGSWSIAEAREATSVALRLHSISNSVGRPPKNAVYTIRITKNAVPEIRKRLTKLFGYEYSTIYPDYMGFSSYATPWLKRKP